MRDNPFLEATAAGLLDTIAARHPDRPAMVLDDERVTFAEFRRRADILARGIPTSTAKTVPGCARARSAPPMAAATACSRTPVARVGIRQVDQPTA